MKLFNFNLANSNIASAVPGSRMDYYSGSKNSWMPLSEKIATPGA